MIDLQGFLPVVGRPMTRSEYAAWAGKEYGVAPTGIAIHHFAHDYPDNWTVEGIALDVAGYHTGQQKWPTIGYYAIIAPNGDIAICNSRDTASYHVAGRNHELLGIALSGDFSKHPPTDEQIASFNWWYNCYEVGLPVKGHKDWALSPTSCPGEWLDITKLQGVE